MQIFKKNSNVDFEYFVGAIIGAIMFFIALACININGYQSKNDKACKFLFREVKNFVPEENFEKKLNKNEPFIRFYVQEQDGSRPFKITVARISKIAMVEFADKGAYRDANVTYRFEKALYKKISKKFKIIDYRSYVNKKVKDKAKEHKHKIKEYKDKKYE